MPDSQGKSFEFAFFAAIAIAVGGFGGMAPIPWSISETLIFLLGFALILVPQQSSTAIPYRRLLWFPAALSVWILVQWFASRAGRIFSDPYAIQSHGLALIAAIVSFFIVLEIARARAARQRFVLFLIILGVFEALYGLAEYLAGWPYIWIYPRRYYLTAASGTFVNHNHYSGFLEMVMPLALALALYHGKRSRRSRRSFAGLVDFLGDAEKLKSLLLLLAAVLMVVAIVFSFSRMGMISALVSVAGLCAAFWTAGRRRSEPAATSFRASLLVVFLASAVAVVAWLGVGPIVHRFELLPQNDPLTVSGQGRITLWSEALPLLRAHPFVGIGLGGFPYAFARLQRMQLTYVFNYAHNDYLQLAIELGISCAAALFALIYWLVFRALQAASRARSEFTGAIALGSFAGAIALLVHSAADFNLYIPANAVVFAVILGLGYGQFLEVRAEEASGRHVSRSSRLSPASESVREAPHTAAVQLKEVS